MRFEIILLIATTALAAPYPGPLHGTNTQRLPERPCVYQRSIRRHLPVLAQNAYVMPARTGEIKTSNNLIGERGDVNRKEKETVPDYWLTCLESWMCAAM
jgi:hypothetical protein